MINISATEIDKIGQDKSKADKPKELHARIKSLKEKTSSTKPKFHIQSQSSSEGHLKSIKILSPVEPGDARISKPSESVIDLKSVNVAQSQKRLSYLTMASMVATFIWIGLYAYYLIGLESINVMSLSIHEWGGYLSFMLVPPALLWLILSNVQRQRDVELYTHALRSELHSILFPKGADPDRIERDVAKLSRQASQISGSSSAIMNAARAAQLELRDDIRGFMALSKKTEFHLTKLSTDLTKKTETLSEKAKQIETRFKDIERTTSRIDKDSSEVSNRLENSAHKIHKTHNKLFDRLQKQQKKVGQLNKNIKLSIKEISQNIDNQEEKLSLSSDRISNIAISSEKLLTEPLKTFETQIKVIDDKHEGLSSVIDARISNLSEVGDRAVENIRKTANDLREQVRHVSGLSGEITAQTQTLSRELDSQKDSANSLVEDSLQNIYKVIDNVEDALKKSNDLASKSENIINNISNNIKVSSEDLGAVSDAAVQRLRKYSGQVNEELSRFDAVTDMIKEKSSHSISNMKETFVSLVPHCETVICAIDKMDKRFIATKDSVSAIASENIEQLRTLKKEVDDQVLHSDKVAQSIVSRLDQLNDNFSDTISNVESAQSSLEKQGNDLSETMSAARTEIQNVTNELGDTARMTADVSEEVVAKITESITHTELQTDKLHKTIKQRANQASQFAEYISKHSKDVLDETHSQLKDLEKSRHIIVSHHKEMEGQFESILGMSGHYSDEIRKQTKLLSQNALEATDHIDKASSDLTRHISRLGQAAETTSDKIHATQLDIDENTRSFAKTSSDILKFSNVASDHVEKHAKKLEKTLKDIEKSNLKVSETAAESGQVEFVTSARYLLESIYSITVDVTRALNGEISQKMWKAYQAGDTGVFLRYLQKVEKDVPANTLIQKFKVDMEFKTYAARYISQFEKIIQDLEKYNQNDLLKDVIMSSDTAKLYRILCIAAEKNPVWIRNN